LCGLKYAQLFRAMALTPIPYLQNQSSLSFKIIRGGTI